MAKRRINLALQGGGAHGAFAWGVLDRLLDEPKIEISGIIRNNHRFGDHALIRRAMIDGKLITRTLDGREYRRIEQQPTGEALALIRLVSARAA